METSKEILNVGGEKIVIKKLGLDPKPNFVFLHGAGIGRKERIESIADGLIAADISILSFDFSGHGESSGTLSSSSLKKRLEEAKAVVSKYANLDNLTVAGASMGAYIAIKLLVYFKISNLILFYPAIYTKEVFDIQFNSYFSESIRKPESWRNSDAYSLLNNFTGNLLIVIGQKDDIIPFEVINLLDNNSANATHKEIIRIPDSPHILLEWIKDKPEIKKYIIEKIVNYSKA